MIETIKNIAAVVGCVSACIALATAIFKPMRAWIIGAFTQKSQQKALHEKTDAMDKKIDKLLDNTEKLETRLTRVETNVLENEADRLRSELFDCGNRCRRHIRLHPEEFEHLRNVYHKYSEVLKQNGEGETEMMFITKYYNNQDFPEYHQPIN